MTRMRWTSRRRSISFHQGEHGGRWLFRHMATSSTTWVAKILVRHRMASCGKDNLGKFCWNLDGNKYRSGNVFFVHRKQGLFLSVHVDDMKMAGRQQNTPPTWKKLMENVDLEEPTSFLDHVFLGCTQSECKSNESIIEKYAKMFRSRISAGATQKIEEWEKFDAKNCRVVLRHRSTCEKVRREVWRPDKQKDRALVHSFNALLGWSQLQEGGVGNSRRIVWCMFSNRLKMLVIDSNRETWHSLVRKKACTCSHQMDTSLWESFNSCYIKCSSHEWLSTILSCE